MRWRDLLHPLQHLQATLCLARFRCLVAKTIDVALDMLDFFLLATE